MVHKAPGVSVIECVLWGGVIGHIPNPQPGGPGAAFVRPLPLDQSGMGPCQHSFFCDHYDTKLHFNFANCQNKQYHLKVLLNSFHLNGHTLGFHSQTQKLQPHLLTQGLTVGVKRDNVKDATRPL